MFYLLIWTNWPVSAWSPPFLIVRESFWPRSLQQLVEMCVLRA